MANITTQSPIRYNIDTLDTASYGVIISDANALDCSNASKVSACTISGNIPANCKAFFLFRLDNSYVKLNVDGTARIITSDTPDFDTLQNSGNTYTELNALNNIPAFAGKRFGVAIGLLASDPDNAVPSVALSLECETSSQILQTVKYSPVYNFDKAQIVSINAPVALTGQGKISLTAQYTDAKGNKSEWLPVEQITGKQINALQFKADYSVDAADSNSSAALNSADVVYSSNDGLSNGVNFAELITLTQNWYMNLKECRLTVKHAPLINSKLRAFAALRPEPVIVHSEHLGIGTGQRKTFQMKNTSGVKYDSVRLYYDNVRVFSDFEINTAVARITCEAPEGVIVSCDYEYNWLNEEWREMSLTSISSLMDYDNSEYRIAFNDKNLAVCAVKLSLDMTEGYITREEIGTGTGKLQSYKLSHICNNGSIKIYSGSQTLSKNNFALHDDTQYISVNAATGARLYASYNWISEAPVIYQIAAVFSE